MKIIPFVLGLVVGVYLCSIYHLSFRDPPQPEVTIPAAEELFEQPKPWVMEIDGHEIVSTPYWAIHSPACPCRK